MGKAVDKDSERSRLLSLPELVDLLGLGSAFGHDIAAVWAQTAFRGYADDGVPGSATAKAAENVNWTQDTDINFRVRIEFEETAGASPTVGIAARIQYNRNTLGWNNVTTTSSVVRAFASPHYVDEELDNVNRLTTGARTFITGMLDETGQCSPGIVFSNNQGETEYCLQIRSVDVSDGDTIELRLINNTTAFATYTNTPSITVNIPAGSQTVTPNAIASSAAVGSPTVIKDQRVILLFIIGPGADVGNIAGIRVTLSPSAIASTAAVPNPTAANRQTVAPSAIASTAVVFQPTVGRQFARPDGDNTLGNWTDQGGGTTNIYSTIDEVTASDADYIKSPLPSSANAFICTLQNVDDPVFHTGHFVKGRVWCDRGTATTVVANLELRQGTTQIVLASSTITAGENMTWKDFLLELSEAQAAAITDYTDLRLRFYSLILGGTVNEMRFSWAVFDIPPKGPAVIVPNVIASAASVGAPALRIKALPSAIASTAAVSAPKVYNAPAQSQIQSADTLLWSGTPILSSGYLFDVPNYYVAFSASGLRVFKQSVYDSSWSEVDTANRPTSETNITGLNLVMDAAGVIHMTWFHRPATLAVRYCTFNTSTDAWGTPEDVTTANLNDDFDNRSAIDIDASNKPHVAYAGGVTAHVWYTEKTGANWTTPVQVDTANGGRNPALIIDNDNANIHVVWKSATSRDVLHRHKTTAGGWQTQETAGTDAVSDTNRNVHFPLTIHSGILALAGWWDPEVTSDWEIRFLKRTAAGSWSMVEAYTQTWEGSIEWGVDLAVVDGQWIISCVVDGTGQDGYLSYLASADGVAWSVPKHISGLIYEYSRLRWDQRSLPRQFSGKDYLEFVAERTLSAIVDYIPLLLPHFIFASAIASTAAVPQPTVVLLTTGITPDAIASTAAASGPIINLRIAPISISAASAIGNPLVVNTQLLAPNAIASAASVPNPTILQITAVQPNTIASTSAVGNPVVSAGQTIAPDNIASTAAVGNAKLNLEAAPNSIASVAAAGAPSVAHVAQPDVISSGAAAGQPKLNLRISPAAVASAAAVGEPSVNISGVVGPVSIGSQAGVAQPKLNLRISPNAIASAAAVGNPALSQVALTIQPDSIASTANSPGAKINFILSPNSIGSAAVIGNPAIVFASQIIPSLIISSSEVAEPTILRGTPSRGGFRKLVALREQARQMQIEDRAAPLVDCPICGHGLDENRRGEVNCPFEHFRQTGREREAARLS